VAVGREPASEQVALEIPARPEYVVLGRLALSGLLREHGFSADAVADLKLALTEACSNSIRHAYEAQPGQVALGFHVTDDRITMVIRDNGAGFHEYDPDCPDCASVGATGLAESGMGISIIRAVVDDFSLDHPPGGGTTLTLTKLCDA